MPFFIVIGLFAMAVISIKALYYIAKWLIVVDDYVFASVGLFLMFVVLLVCGIYQFLKDVTKDLTYYIRGKWL